MVKRRRGSRTGQPRTRHHRPFEDLVDLALASIPDPFAEALDEVAIVIADEPSPYAFSNTTVAPFDYHIGGTSSARDASTVPSTVDEDFDGQFRPLGPAKDVGADEFKP